MSKNGALAGIVSCLFIIAVCLAVKFSPHEKSSPSGTPCPSCICMPCTFLDEEGGTETSWNDDDPELKGFPKGEDGLLQPVRDSSGKIIKDLPPDYPGIKTLHIPFLRGFQIDMPDHRLNIKCKPCREAEGPAEIQTCNDKYGYEHLDTGIVPDDIDDAHTKEKSMGE